MHQRIRFEIRRAAVVRQIFCPVSGQVLDVATAVLIESTASHQVVVVSPQGWRQRRAMLTEAHERGILRLVVENAPADDAFTPTGD